MTTKRQATKGRGGQGGGKPGRFLLFWFFFLNGYEVEISISGEITRANIKRLRQMTKRSVTKHLMARVGVAEGGGEW